MSISNIARPASVRLSDVHKVLDNLDMFITFVIVIIFIHIFNEKFQKSFTFFLSS